MRIHPKGNKKELYLHSNDLNTSLPNYTITLKYNLNVQSNYNEL